MRTLRTLLVVLGLGLAVSPARGQDTKGDDVTMLEALDVALPRAVERAARSVVLLDVQRDKAASKPLSARERAELGLSALGPVDHRYFERPSGPVTGVIVAREGTTLTIATCAWNLAGVKSVALFDPATGLRRAGTPAGRDDNLDVALLTVKDVEAKDLVAIERAPAPKPGEMVMLVAKMATGAPFATLGNVSALGRYRGDALQVSARMSYGNTGGAVIDLDGRLVGIASRLSDRSRNGQSSGVGFAAPVEKLIPEVPDLAAGKVIEKRKSPFMGVQIDMREGPGGTGVRIGKVLPNSAAAAAGIQDGDVIKIFHGTELKDYAQLREELDRLAVGEKVIVTIYRPSLDGEKDFTVHLGARPEEQE
jgi:S1-C subfamily serine protease